MTISATTQATTATRVLNLTRVMNENFERRQSNLARAIHRKPDYIWRVLNGRKGFGETLARDIERLLTLPEGWLDDPANSTTSGGIPDAASRIIVVPLYQQTGDAEGVPVRVEKLAINDGGEHHLATIDMDDQSMTLSIPQGDQVIINTADKTPSDGLLFYIRHGATAKIRRITLDSGGQWIIRCDTADKMRHPDVRIPESELKIIGRVLWAAGRR